MTDLISGILYYVVSASVEERRWSSTSNWTIVKIMYFNENVFLIYFFILDF